MNPAAKRVRAPRLPVIEIAAICHEANRQLCLLNGDTSQPSFNDAPDWQRESALLGIEAILTGRVTEPWHSHQSWSEHKAAEGWRFGPIKDPVAKTHPCLVPFAELPEHQQLKDSLFLGIVLSLSYGIPALPIETVEAQFSAPGADL